MSASDYVMNNKGGFMSKYESMGDFDINRAVFHKLNNYWEDLQAWPPKGNDQGYYVGDGNTWESYDYCNNPSHAWPVIFENEISLVVLEDGLWVARVGSIYSEGANPLRAAMIVLLRIGDDESGQ